jgi:hypothetical protein
MVGLRTQCCLDHGRAALGTFFRGSVEEGRLEFANTDDVFIVQCNARLEGNFLVVDKGLVAAFQVLDVVAIVEAQDLRVPAANDFLVADYRITIRASA